MHSHQFCKLFGCLLMIQFCLPDSASIAGDIPICERDRPTFNKWTRDPRPDILPYWLTNLWPDYRQIYNRPTYLGGKIAQIIEPSSQEAMVWAEAKQLGLYCPLHQPALRRTYYAPKPWERLATGPRPDRRTEAQSPMQTFMEEVMSEEVDTNEEDRILYAEEFSIEED